MSTAAVSLITGASRGIGKATALRLAEAGHELILLSRDLTALEQVQQQCLVYGGVVSIRALDITDRAAVNLLFQQLHQGILPGDRLQHLIHCAGQMQDNLLAMTRMAEVDQLLTVNISATMHFCQLSSKLMLRRRNGNLVLLASKVGESGAAGQSLYAATKAAVSALVKSLAKELGPAGIRVNAVAPGFINTDLTAHYSEAQKQQLQQQISLRRLGQPDEVATVIRFLCSADARYIHGHILAVDGGFSL